jgi:hypothetical protein
MSPFVLSTIASSSPRSRSGTPNFREGLVEVVHERIPLRTGDEQLAVRVQHRAAGVGVRAARRQQTCSVM